jgi:hypothetical protein
MVKEAIRAYICYMPQTITSRQLIKPITVHRTYRPPGTTFHCRTYAYIVDKHRPSQWSTPKPHRWKSQSTTSGKVLLPLLIIIHQPIATPQALHSQQLSSCTSTSSQPPRQKYHQPQSHLPTRRLHATTLSPRRFRSRAHSYQDRAQKDEQRAHGRAESRRQCFLKLLGVGIGLVIMLRRRKR